MTRSRPTARARALGRAALGLACGAVGALDGPAVGLAALVVALLMAPLAWLEAWVERRAPRFVLAGAASVWLLTLLGLALADLQLSYTWTVLRTGSPAEALRAVEDHLVELPAQGDRLLVACALATASAAAFTLRVGGEHGTPFTGVLVLGGLASALVEGPLARALPGGPAPPLGPALFFGMVATLVGAVLATGLFTLVFLGADLVGARLERRFLE